jgi:hypothetical protein
MVARAGSAANGGKIVSRRRRGDFKLLLASAPNSMRFSKLSAIPNP